jgi:uncharacterized protein (UPF0210 family)
MELRTITAGAREEDLARAAKAAQAARERLTAAGYTVQTLRVALATSGSNRCGDFATIAQAAEEQALAAGFDYLAIGQLDDDRLAALPEAIVATSGLFASAPIVDAEGRPRPTTIRLAAEAIAKIGAGTDHGFGNLRFAASAFVGPGSPFFPAAYHAGGGPWLAVGPEAASLAVEATKHQAPTTENHADISQAVLGSRFAVLPSLTALIEQHDAQIAAALGGLATETGVPFAGCDWSLAPHPDPHRSVGAAIEALAGVPFGGWGTLAGVRALTAAIRAAKVAHLGFSGVMLPVLEDAVLAQRNAEGRYTLRDLLAFSAVCGTGLDTIPLPGDSAPEQIAGVLTEVATLASTLRKPLTARLLPIPGLRAGDMTTFDFPYFVNTRVMGLV